MSAPIRITESSQPIFPCWLWRNKPSPGTWLRSGFTGVLTLDPYSFWLPDQPEAPTVIPAAEAVPVGKSLIESAAEMQRSPVYSPIAPPVPAQQAHIEELAYLKDYVIPEKDKHSNYWRDLAQERIAQLAHLEADRDALLKLVWTAEQGLINRVMPDDESGKFIIELIRAHLAGREKKEGA